MIVTTTEPNNTAMWMQTYSPSTGTGINADPARVKTESFLTSRQKELKIIVQNLTENSESALGAPTTIVVRDGSNTITRYRWFITAPVSVDASDNEGSC